MYTNQEHIASSEESSQLDDVRIEVHEAQQKAFLKNRSILYLIIFLILCEVGVYLGQLWDPKTQTGATMYVVAPILYFVVSFILSLLVSLIPLKGLLYKQKLVLQTLLMASILSFMAVVGYGINLACDVPTPESDSIEWDD